MKRLEALAGCALFLRSQGASPLLTGKGLYLLERARELVALNDDIVLCLKGPAPAVGVNDRSRRFAASILVRPFGNMSGDPAQDYLAQGISAATLGALSRMRWLRVIADDGGANTRGVRYALAGAVAREGGRMRLNARVIDVESGSHLWAEAFDAPADDVFAVQDRIADRIAGLLEPELMQSEIFRAAARRQRQSTPTTYTFRLSRSLRRIPPQKQRPPCRCSKKRWRLIPTTPPHMRFSPGRTNSASRGPGLKKRTGAPPLRMVGWLSKRRQTTLRRLPSAALC
jgi:TolB-like protein